METEKGIHAVGVDLDEEIGGTLRIIEARLVSCKPDSWQFLLVDEHGKLRQNNFVEHLAIRSAQLFQQSLETF